MTKTKSTKRALLSSVLALVVCIAMLVGSTFAWFTDNASTAVNQIVAGNLDIVLEYQKADGSWDNAEGKTLEWVKATGAENEAILWEPGCTYKLPALRVRNEGNLALKYTLIINGVIGDAGLLKVIDFTANDQPISNFNGKLYAKGKTGDTSDAIVIEGHMQETAGNEYQGLTLSGISVAVFATQLNYENDSYTSDYDKLATYSAGSTSELEDLLKLGGKITLEKDITVDKPITVPAGVTAVVDLNGKTITGTKGRDADNNRIHVIVNNGILTIKDGTVKSAGNDGGSAIYNNAGATLTIEDVTLYGAPQSDPIYEAGVSKPFPSYAVNNYGNAVVNGATVKSYHGAIATGGNGVTVINDADIDVGLGQSTGITSYAIYSFDDAQVTINGGKFAFTKQEIYVNGGNTFCELGTNPIIINGGNYIGTSFSTGAGREYVIKGGTFDKDPTAYVANGYVATKNADGTYTVIKTIATTNELKTALTKGGNIVLGDDIDLTNTLMATKDVVIDLNGNEITAPASGNMFQSQSNASPDIIITSSTAGAAINISGGDTAVLLGYGSTVIKNVTINVNGCDNYSPNPFKVYGDLTLGEGTVVNVDYLGTSLINNNGANAIVIDGAKINIGTFKTNAGAIISLSKGATLALKNTEVKVGLDTTYTSYFIKNADGATITGCTFDITDKNGTAYDIVFKPDASVGAKYAWVQK